VKDGWLKFTQHKNRNRKPVTLELPILPQLQAIIDATPSGNMTFLATAYGKPFSAAGFGNRFREWCDRAGLPHCSAHGLRKAGACIAAENGASESQLMAIFGWQTMQQAAHYTKAARQRRIAGTSMHLLLHTADKA
jgi:integrase